MNTTTPDSPAYRSPAADLRLAAEGMRKDAEKARGLTGDAKWTVRIVPASAGMHREPPAHMVVADGRNVARVSPQAAEYVAGMDPAVALAVADWLEEVAADRHPSLPAWVEDAALAVAGAYLDSEPAESAVRAQLGETDVR
jgi:hypothetical protein